MRAAVGIESKYLVVPDPKGSILPCYKQGRNHGLKSLSPHSVERSRRKKTQKKEDLDRSFLNDYNYGHYEAS